MAFINPLLNLLSRLVGKKVSFRVSLDLLSKLPSKIMQQVNLWAVRFSRFNVMFGRLLFIEEALHIIVIMLYTKDISIFMM